jgi:hypothetical protein
MPPLAERRVRRGRMRQVPGLADVHVEADAGVVGVDLRVHADPDRADARHRIVRPSPPQREGNALLLDDVDRLEEVRGIAVRRPPVEIVRRHRIQLLLRAAGLQTASALQLLQKAVDLCEPKPAAALELELRLEVLHACRIVWIAGLGRPVGPIHRPSRPMPTCHTSAGAPKAGVGRVWPWATMVSYWSE